MKIKRAWALQSFLICFVFNAILAGLLFLMAEKITSGLDQWMSSLVNPGSPSLTDDARTALSSAGLLVAQLHQYLAPTLAAVTGSVTLLLWLFVFLLGRRLIDRASARDVPTDEVCDQVHE